jgi:hypothetical protein
MPICVGSSRLRVLTTMFGSSSTEAVVAAAADRSNGTDDVDVLAPYHPRELEVGTVLAAPGGRVSKASLARARLIVAVRRRKNWLSEAFGRGEARRFIDGCVRDGLEAPRALERLAGVMHEFHNKRELERVANELFRSPSAGAIVSEVLTFDVLSELVTPPRGGRRVR